MKKSCGREFENGFFFCRRIEYENFKKLGRGDDSDNLGNRIDFSGTRRSSNRDKGWKTSAAIEGSI